MSRFQHSFENHQQHMFLHGKQDNGWPTRPSRIVTESEEGRPVPGQTLVDGVTSHHGTHQDHRVASSSNASQPHRAFRAETPIANRVQPRTSFSGGGAMSMESPWHPSNISSNMSTKYTPVTPPTSFGNIGGNSIAGGKSSSGNYARSIAAWDSRVSIDNLPSYGTYVRPSNEPLIANSPTSIIAGTNELDKLCLQASELFVGGVRGVGGVGRKTEEAGI